MLRRNAEIWIALAAIVVVTALYGVAVALKGALPGASTLVGHSIGAVGFVLMLMTEVLYSIRKQMTTASWGPMAGWLQFHIVTGLVGPYMVLLHTAMRFSGLAGVAMLLTAVTVASGIVGRYLYTAVPRGTTVPSTETPAADRSARGRGAESPPAGRNALATWHALHVPLTWALFAAAFVHTFAALYYATLQR